MWKFDLEASRFQTALYASTVLGLEVELWMEGLTWGTGTSPGSEEHSGTCKFNVKGVQHPSL